MRQIFGAIAEYDKAMTVIKLRAARQRKRATTGRCEGAKPYGTLDGESAIVQRIQSLRSTGMALDTIAETLNAEGVKPRSGKRWYPTSIARVLSR